MGGEVSTDFKSLNRIEISWLVQVLLNFDWFWGSLLGGGGSGGWWEVPPTHVHMHACTCAYDNIENSQGFPKNPKEAAICMKLSCLPHMHVQAHVCMHVHACAHVWEAPPTTPHPHPPTPHPNSHREPKTPKFNNSWTNRDNSILFEDSLPLNIPELI